MRLPWASQQISSLAELTGPFQPLEKLKQDVWINGRGQHYLETPFGGYKDSGLGSEGSMESLQSYTRLKALHILDLEEIGNEGELS